MIASKAETFPFLRFLFRNTVDIEVVMSIFSLISCEELDSRVNGEHETCDITLICEYVSNWPVLVCTKHIICLLSLPK